MSTSPRITALELSAPPEAWTDAGFTVTGGAVVVGGLALRFVDGERGLVGWTLDGDETAADPPGVHPNGANDVDHVVLMTPDLDATVDELAGQGFEARRTRDAGGGITQVFYRAGAVLEVVGPLAVPAPYLWGIVFTTRDLDATVAFLGDHIGAPKDAVQPGRRIATIRASANLATAVAFMSARRPDDR